MVILIRNIFYTLFVVTSFLYAQRFVPQTLTFQLQPLVFSFFGALLSPGNVNRRIFLFVIGLILFTAANSFVYETPNLGVFVHLATLLFVSRLFKRIQSDFVLLLPFIVYVVYVLVRIYELKNPGLVFINSRNYVSLYSLVLVAPYYIRNHRNISVRIWPALLNVLVCIIALGRSGIITSAILLMAVIFQRKSPILILLFLLIGFSIFRLLVNIDTEFDFQDLERLQSLSDGGRENIYVEISKLDFYKFFIGWMPEELPSVAHLGHMHSSWLTMASVVGFVPIIGSFNFVAYKKVFRLRSGNNLSSFLLISALVLRMATDVGLLYSPFDYVMWMMIFL